MAAPGRPYDYGTQASVSRSPTSAPIDCCRQHQLLQRRAQLQDLGRSGQSLLVQLQACNCRENQEPAIRRCDTQTLDKGTKIPTSLAFEATKYSGRAMIRS